MSLSPMVAKWATVYEQEHGKKPGELVIRIAEHVKKVCKILNERGQKDAQQGKCAHPADFFPALVIKAFGMDISKHPDTVQAIADLWQSDYMDGYTGTKQLYPGAATERAVQAQIEKQLEKAVSKALDDIFKDWK